MLGLGLAVAVSGCLDVIALRPELRTAAATHDALALADGMEQLIDEGRDHEHDRQAAYEVVRQWPQNSAEYAYARAVLAGRLAQLRGLAAAQLVGEMERWTQRSISFDPRFRDGAASRMLGTLYVLAPASLLKHGDSEKGLELLETQLGRYPNNLENRLRLAEAYVSLDDPEPAAELLCACLAGKTALRPDSQRLLARLVDAIGPGALGCAGGRQR